MAKERIGIMGGTFDPIHLGHIRMAQCALEQMKLDRVLMLPTGNPPHKAGITPAEDRYRMVCAACAGLEGLTPSRVELDRQGTVYTVDTLSILHEKYPKAELYYIIGADTLMELQRWRRYEEVLQLCRFLICPRSWHYGAEELAAEQRRLEALGGRFNRLEMEVVDVSSTGLREALRQDLDTPLLPLPVRQYAISAGLYGLPLRVAEAPRYLAWLHRELTSKRFAHTLAVAATARHLALRHGVDPILAETAALLHDCAKCMPLKDMQKLCLDHRLTEDESLLESGALLHSVAGAHRAAAELGVTDPRILSAIAAHTTGKPGMSPLDMVVWLADTIEPTRAPYPLLTQVQALAEVSLEKALLTSMEGTLAYVKKGGKSVHPATLRTVEWLRTLPACQP